MALDNHEFRKNGRKIFLARGLDRANQLDGTAEMSFCAQTVFTARDRTSGVIASEATRSGGRATLLQSCLCTARQIGPDHEVMKRPDRVEIGEAQGIVGMHNCCRDEQRAHWRMAPEQR